MERGPANDPKDAIAPLEGLVETDWAVATAAMSWRFTRPNTWIDFAQDEPICMGVPQRIDPLEETHPRILSEEARGGLFRNSRLQRHGRDAF